MPIRTGLIDELLKDYTWPQDILGEDGLLKQLTKAVVERALGAELTHHLGYEPGDAAAKAGCRNGYTSKTVVTNHGPIEIVWLGVLTELKTRGVRDVFVACVDGLTGFADAIEAALPRTMAQSCVVHPVRNSLAFVSYRNRKAVASALRPIYNAATAEAGYAAIDEFEAPWGARYPTIARGWRANWARLSRTGRQR